MRDFERAYRGAGETETKGGLDIAAAGAIDKRVACVYRPPRKTPPPPASPAPHPRRRRGSAAGALSSSSYSSSSSSWDPEPRFSCDSEAKRRRRVASYKAYGAESKLKDAVRRGLRWIKVRCSGIVEGR